MNGSRTAQRRQAMLTNLRIVLSLALVVATVSAAVGRSQASVASSDDDPAASPCGSHLSLNSVRSRAPVRSTGTGESVDQHIANRI
jgi:hypothetical protein